MTTDPKREANAGTDQHKAKNGDRRGRPRRTRWLRKLAFSSFPLAVVAYALFIMYRPPPPESLRINQSNFDRIQEGMTKAEVEEIFGCPPGNYSGRGDRVFWVLSIFENVAVANATHRSDPRISWKGDQAQVTIWVTGSKVTRKGFCPFPAETLTERFSRLDPYANFRGGRVPEW